MSLTTYSLRQTRVVLMALFAVTVLGVVGYQEMARNSMPPFTIRVAKVVTAFPGAGPERVESLVTKPIETVIQEIPEVDTISSDSRTGLSVVSVNLREDVPAEKLREVWDRLRRKVASLERTLPDGSQPPDVKDDNIGVVYGVVVGLQNDGFSHEEMEVYAERVRDRILTLPDAAEVKIGGLLEPQIYIDYSPARLADIGLTAMALQQTLAATNIIFPGGEVVLGQERVILEPSGNLDSLEALKNLLVPLPKGGSVPLGQITEVSRRYRSPPSALVRINGTTGATLSVAIREGANLIRLGQQVDRLMAELRLDLPIGVEVFRVAAQDVEVKKKVDGFVESLLQSIAAVFGVMLVMLGLRIGLVVASLIPMAILVTLFMMVQMDLGLNQVTLAGLIMALGMLVDNAIVVSEAMLVEMKRGRTPAEAAEVTSSELSTPLMISSLTTSAAFMAFYLAESVMGEMVGGLFVVITLALLGSWLLSMTMIPLLLTWVARRDTEEKKEEVFIRVIRAAYGPTLKVCLRFKWLVALAIIPLFAGTMMSAGSLPFIFFPDSDRPLVQVDVQLPLGTQIEVTDAAVAKLEAYVRASLADEVINVSAFIGEGPSSYDLGYQPAEPNTSYAHLLVNTQSGDVNAKVINSINDFALDHLPNAAVQARLLVNGGGGVPVEIRLSGDSPELLYALAEQVKQKLITVPGTRNVGDDWGPRLKKFVVKLEQQNLRSAGLTNQDVAVSLQTALTGFKTADFREDDTLIPITMRAAGATEYRVDDVRNILVHKMTGGAGVPLSQVGDVQLAWQYPRIKRRTRVRSLSVTCYLKDGYTARDISKPMTAFLEAEHAAWPAGYAYELGGESERSDKGMQSIIDKLPYTALIILMLLIVQFNSMRKTIIVLVTIPLGVIGVVLGLHIFQSFFGFFGFIGIISLSGIIINNAIVLLDRIRIEIEETGLPPAEAVIAASHHRLRPIVLTTLTTTVGLIPLYIGGGLMWEPLAVALMSGLFFGTVITLVIVPSLYSILFRVPPLAPRPAPEPVEAVELEPAAA